MKLLVMSDLHLEMGVDPEIPAELRKQADVVVLAGDIHNGTAGLVWARQTFPQQPIVYVPGNHEYYDAELNHTLEELRQCARRYDIHFLEHDETFIGGVRFLGCCLWTDYELYGAENYAASIQIGLRIMVDYRAIRFHERGLSPEDTIVFHQKAKAWLRDKLATASATPTVVVTHHLPSFACVAERYKMDFGSAGFASRLDDLVQQADLWICGHTHDAFDIKLGQGDKGRVVCNPRGYVRNTRQGIKQENAVWKPILVEI